MSVSIERVLTVLPDLAVTDSSTTSPAFGFGSHAGGTFSVVSSSLGATAFTIQWWVAAARSSDFYQLFDPSNAAITTTAQQGRAYPMPDSLFGAANVKAVIGTAGATATLRFSFKG